MYKILIAIITIIWIGDICDFPQLTMLDTTYPINGLAWTLIWLFLPTTNAVISNNKDNK